MNDKKAKTRYFLKGTWKGSKWEEVSMKEFIIAERSAGFRSKFGSNSVATAGFSSESIKGTVSYDGKEPKD